MCRKGGDFGKWCAAAISHIEGTIEAKNWDLDKEIRALLSLGMDQRAKLLTSTHLDIRITQSTSLCTRLKQSRTLNG